MIVRLEADYLVVGAGAMGMAFVDTLVAETDATVVVVDRHHQPGGHWNVAYPYVRLHQPSTGYGVNSRRLGGDAIDHQGGNAGLLELATAGEVCSYFDQVMQQTLLPTGRVRYHPMAVYEGDGRFRSLVTGDRAEVVVGRRVVDATYQLVSVPSMRPPPYEVGAGVACVAPNALTGPSERYQRYTVVGGGKTGIDACLWLLRHGVDADAMTWIVPRDSWLLDRALLQPGPLFADPIATAAAEYGRAVLDAQSLDDLFERVEASGRLLRLDPHVRPTMYRCATVSHAELAQLRRITDVVRLGRVRRIDADEITLDSGTVPTTPATLHVDCTADGLARRPGVPVFESGRITLQSVRTCQQVFSAAFIAHVEAAYTDDVVKNDLCVPVPHPNTDVDFVRNSVADARNERRWGDDPALQQWLDSSRLNWIRHLGPALPTDPTERADATRRRRAATDVLSAKLETLLEA